MAVLDDDSIPHPPIEAVFTVDEEIGLLGATGLDGSDLKSRTLINLDSENEGVLTVGCAGGARCDLRLDLEQAPFEGAVCTLSIGGLSGGHSGTAINLGLANADKLLADCLKELGYPRLVSIHGGAQDNAIPTQAVAVIAAPPAEAGALGKKAVAWLEKARAAYPNEKGNMCVTWDGKDGSAQALTEEASRKAVELILDAPNGVQAMEPDLPGQVQTSLNLGILSLENGGLSLTFCIRSSSAAAKADLSNKLKALIEGRGGSFSQRGDYPPWEYRKDSRLRDVMVRVFREQYGREPAVETIHAGLECGIFSDKLPGLDAVSMGPDLVEIHSTRERMSIPSVQRLWKYLLNVLKEL